MIELTINRRIYTITERDRFLDNGYCVQLLTQSKEKSHWGHSPTPVLGKGALKVIGKYEKRYHPYRSAVECKCFSLVLPKDASASNAEGGQ